MIAVIISVLILSTGYQAQKKYDYCKEKDFAEKYCELEKKLSRYEK